MKQIEWQVTGMSCGHCKQSVEKAIASQGAVGVVDLMANTVSITFDEMKIDLHAIRSAIEDQGYEVAGN